MNFSDNRHNKLQLSRRQFLIGAVNSSIVMAFAPLSFVPKASAAKSISEKAFSPSVWFEVKESGKVLVNIARCEMGQHVGTALAQIVAEELGADWNDIEIKQVSSEAQWGFVMTGGSWSVFQMYKPLSQAGAAGRLTLIEAGAKLLKVAPQDCIVKNSKVISGTKSVSFADIVKTGSPDKTFTPEELANLPIKSPQHRNIIGKDRRALDIKGKTEGTAVFGIDVELQGMVFARPVIPPTRYGSKVLKVDDTTAKQIKGYLGYEVLKDASNGLQGWVSVLADNYHAAIKAGDAIKIQYQAGPAQHISEQDIINEGIKLVNQREKGVLFVNDGNVDKAFAESDKVYSQTYVTHTAMHFQMEPLNALAEIKDGICHIHCGNQSHSISIPMIAAALDMPAEKVFMHNYFLGGGFGRRAMADYAVPAALTAKQVGKPVKMVFTRADDSKFDQARSPSVQKISGTIDKSGKMNAYEHILAAGWPTLAMVPGFMPPGLDGQKLDPFSTSGSDHWYSIPNNKVRTINNSVAQRTFNPGWLRSVGPGWISFGTESFLDEMAHANGVDPIQYRLDMLDGAGKNKGHHPHSSGGAKRLAKVLERCKTQSGWGKPLPENEGMGIATCYGQEREMPTWIACAAQVAVDPKSGSLDVRKITMTVDCGTVVHPDSAIAQIQGSVAWGVSLAIHEGTEIKDGNYAASNFHNYTPLRMNDLPEMDIAFIESDEFPVGLGEPGVIAVAPAIANAIFNAVGARVRELPIKAHHIRAALSA